MVGKRRLSIHLYELHPRRQREGSLDKALPTKHSNGLHAYQEKAQRALQRLASQRQEEKEAERLSRKVLSLWYHALGACFKP